MWDSITHVHDEKNAEQEFIRKCATFQTAQLCATSDNPEHKSLKLNLKIGKHKFHRTYRPWEQKEADALQDISNIYSDNDKRNIQDTMKNMKMQSDNFANDEQEEWGIDSGVIDVDDSEWNNDALWTSTKVIPKMTSKHKKRIIRKCRGQSFCLCQYLDKKFDNGQKHKCVSFKNHQKVNPHYKLLNMMDHFMAGPIGLAHQRKLPVQIKFQYHPSIVHLHIMGKYPFFNRRHHMHRFRIPWFKYKKYQHLRPNNRYFCLNFIFVCILMQNLCIFL